MTLSYRSPDTAPWLDCRLCPVQVPSEPTGEVVSMFVEHLAVGLQTALSPLHLRQISEPRHSSNHIRDKEFYRPLPGFLLWPSMLSLQTRTVLRYATVYGVGSWSRSYAHLRSTPATLRVEFVRIQHLLLRVVYLPVPHVGRWHQTLFRFGSALDRKSTRLNSSHGYISYAVFCLKKKKSLDEVVGGAQDPDDL